MQQEKYVRNLQGYNICGISKQKFECWEVLLLCANWAFYN